jgi:hypothetical protein
MTVSAFLCFWRNVVLRAARSTFYASSFALGDNSRYSKIGEVYDPISNQDIGWFDILVLDAHLMKVIECSDKAAGPLQKTVLSLIS